jgi:hypothetical protein
MKKPAQHLIAEVPRRQTKFEMTIGVGPGDVWSHYCTLNEEGVAVNRGCFRTSPKGVEKWFSGCSVRILSAQSFEEIGLAHATAIHETECAIKLLCSPDRLVVFLG